MEILGVEIGWTLLFQVINLLVLYFLLKKFLFGPVKAIIAERQSMVKADLDDAETAKEEANKSKEEYENILTTADEKATQIVARATSEAKEKAGSIVENAKQESAQIIEQANQTVQIEKEKTIAEVQTEIATLALAAASKIMEKDVDNESNKKYLDEFLMEANAYDDAGSR